MIAKINFVVASYLSHATAEGTIKELQPSGVDMKMLAIVGHDYHSNEHGTG